MLNDLGNRLRKVLTKNLVDLGQAIVALKYPGEVITEDMTSFVEVGQGNMLRVIVAAQTFVVFDSDIASAKTADVAASPALQLEAGEHYILCQDDFIRMSVNPTRKELLKI